MTHQPLGRLIAFHHGFHYQPNVVRAARMCRIVGAIAFGEPQFTLEGGEISMAFQRPHPWFATYPVSDANIVWHWAQATCDEIIHGMHWYADAHRVACEIAHGNAHLGAGMIAIYSPQQQWRVNLLLAARVLRDGKGLGGPGNGVFASAAQRRAADQLLGGHRYEEILSGPKIRDFAHLIEHGGDRDPATPRVVVDRHALSVACGGPLTVQEYGAAPIRGFRRADGSISRQHYDHVVDLYRRAAIVLTQNEQQPVAAHQVQAVTWLVRQRLNQQAERERGSSALDHGRASARTRAEQRWQRFRAEHLPHLPHDPGTGYLPAA